MPPPPPPRSPTRPRPRASFALLSLPAPLSFPFLAHAGKAVVGYAIDLDKNYECSFSQSSGQCMCTLIPNVKDCATHTHWDGSTSKYGGTCDPAHDGAYSDMLGN